MRAAAAEAGALGRQHSKTMHTTWLVAAALALLPTNGVQPGAEILRLDPAQDLEARLDRITGGSPENCGRLMSPGNWGRPSYRIEDIEEPIECAKAAAGGGKAAVVVLKTLGFDSWTAIGLIAGTDGTLRWFNYDNLYGRGSLNTRPCQTPRGVITADGFAYIDCGEQQANHGLQPTPA